MIYIRPHFEYACEVWDGCTIDQSETLERLQLEAARIVTGLPTYTRREYLYLETGWQTLSERRTVRKLCLIYKISNNIAPLYLANKLPANVGTNLNYNLRNSHDITQPYTRTSLYANSFFPSSIRLWNNLLAPIRHSNTFPVFKSQLNSHNLKIPKYYEYGQRKLNMLHTRLRYSVSPLNYDMYKVSLVNNSSCICGNPCENVHHFFINCPLYRDIRTDLVNNINDILHCTASLDLSLLLYGNSELSAKTNISIFKEIHNFIRKSKRF